MNTEYIENKLNKKQMKIENSLIQLKWMIILENY